MVLTQNVTIRHSLLEKCLNYINSSWKVDYKLEDITGFDIGTNYIFLHIDKDMYPIRINLLLIEGQSNLI